jgi:hypothetical protein
MVVGIKCYAVIGDLKNNGCWYKVLSLFRMAKSVEDGKRSRSWISSNV